MILFIINLPVILFPKQMLW